MTFVRGNSIFIETPLDKPSDAWVDVEKDRRWYRVTVRNRGRSRSGSAAGPIVCEVEPLQQ